MPSAQPSSPTAWRRAVGELLRRLGIDLRPGEGAAVAVLLLLHFVFLTVQYASKALRQASYLDTLGAARLPIVYLAVALAAIPMLALYDRLLARWQLRPLLTASCLVAAVGCVAFWWLLAQDSAWASVFFYLWTALAGLMLVSQLWALAGQRLDPRQARRLFALIGAGGILGSIAGGQVAHLAGRLGDPRAALLACAAVLLAAAMLCRYGLRPAEQSTPGAAQATADATLDRARSGYRIVTASPYLRLLSGLMLVSGLVAQVVDLQFSWAVEVSVQGLEQRTALIGNFYSLMGVAALLFQIVAVGRIHRSAGMGTALRVLPLSNAAGTVLFLAAALAQPLLLLPAVWLLKAGENGLRYSLEQATRELLFLPVPAADRPAAKAFIDVLMQRLAKGVAAVVLLSVSFGWIPVWATALISLLAIVLWLGLIEPTRKRYVTSYRDGLRANLERPEGGVDLNDPATLELLVEGLGSSEARQVQHSLDLLLEYGRPHLVSPWLLHHPEPQIRLSTLRALVDADRRDAAPLVEPLLAASEAEVRAEAARTLACLSAGEAQQLMRERLRDPSPRVRAAALAYLLQSCQQEEDRQQAEQTLDEMLTDGEVLARSEAASALGALSGSEGANALVRLLYDASPEVARAAILAVDQRTARGEASPLFVPILVSHLHNRRLKHHARRALVSYGERVVPALSHFLGDHQESIWVRRALPKTLAEIGGSQATTALASALGAEDLFLRRKVIESLAAARQRHVTAVNPGPDHLPGYGAVEQSTVERHIQAEARSYLRIYLDLASLGSPTPQAHTLRQQGNGSAAPRSGAKTKASAPHLLERLLADRLAQHLGNLFGLLALRHQPRDVQAAEAGLYSSEDRFRCHALEYLDNTLEDPLRRVVLTVVDELPLAERKRWAERLFRLRPRPGQKVIEQLVRDRPTGDADAPWLTAAALCFIRERGLNRLELLITEALRNDHDPLVQETAQWLQDNAQMHANGPPT